MTDEFSEYRSMEPQGGGPVVRLLKVLAVVALIAGSFAIAFVGVKAMAGWVSDALGGDTTVVTVVPGEPVTIEIEPGSSASQIGDVLAAAGVVDSSGTFAREVASRGVAGQLQAGTYDMTTGMTIDDAIALLLEGPEGSGAYRITVIEGLTVRQMLASLARQTPFEVREFEAALVNGSITSALMPALPADTTGSSEPASTTAPTTSTSSTTSTTSTTAAADATTTTVAATSSTFGEGAAEAVYELSDWEGLLWPDTYEISERATAVDILQLLADTTIDRVDSLDWSRLEAVGLTPYDGLIVASMIEREAAFDDERPLVASVIYNRLEIDMLLQIDATVVYALGGVVDEGGLTLADLEIDSPYNTYLHPGLPPTPIAGSRLASLAAAADPAETDFIYYVLTDPEGRHSFTADFDEFLRLQEQARQDGVIP